MAAEALTPIDEIGMPLPLAPQNLGIHDASQPKPDWHHHFHPRKSPLLAGDEDGGLVLRNSRLQKANWTQHHIEYHGYYEGPPLPNTRAERFGLVVLATAGYVPAEAINFTPQGPEVVPLSPDQRHRLWRSGELKNGAPESTRKFLLNHTLEQDLTHVREAVIDEFLHTADEDRRYKLGGTLLNFAIQKAVEPLDPFYRTAWKKGYIDHASAHRPHRLLRTKIRFASHQAQLIDRLQEVLAAA